MLEFVRRTMLGRVTIATFIGGHKNPLWLLIAVYPAMVYEPRYFGNLFISLAIFNQPWLCVLCELSHETHNAELAG